ncbi:MAG: 7-cyano-7-deazaguanine synthase QueC [Hyphomonas sp.]|tara:strand:- start:2194 stop:2901 length:708 start_codon:yes stop_codon:yes gene_type:complete
MNQDHSSALVLFSGGQDSATCLVDALSRYARIETVGFDYGQRHRVELECRSAFLESIRAHFPAWGERLGPDHMLDASILKSLGHSAMTDDVAIEMTKAGLPSTFVPGRNLLFFTLSGALAYRRGLDVLVGGMCETDYSGYPDCRATTMAAQEQTLQLGLDSPIRIETPLMYIDKAATWAMAERLGGQPLVDLIVEQTHTCYLGDRDHRYDWGYGCGTCPACELRASGWKRWKGAA